MRAIAVILARAGSKGLPDKCVLPLLGRPVIAYTIDHALAARGVQAVVLTTDSRAAAAVGIDAGILVVDRPAELANDTARVDSAVRHAVSWYEARTGEPVDAVVILYGNIPVRAAGAIDACLEHLAAAGCSSVRTVAPVSKQHPDWIHRLDGDRMCQFRPNSIHRRQDLEPLYYHDGAVVAVTRASLFADITRDDPHAFFGPDRRALVQRPEQTVDIDTVVDLFQAEAILRYRMEQGENLANTHPGIAEWGACHAE
jgi:CMP-N-acetylneuraminic acid synthetase